MQRQSDSHNWPATVKVISVCLTERKAFTDLVQEQVCGCIGEQISVEKLVPLVNHRKVRPVECFLTFEAQMRGERSYAFLEEAAEQKKIKKVVYYLQMAEICYENLVVKPGNLVFVKMSFCGK